MEGSDAAARLRLALELHDLGEQMMRARLRRERPELTPEEVSAAIRQWLHERPGAAFGDCPGQPSARVLGSPRP